MNREEKAQEPDGHFWQFEDMDELRRALSRYTALLDGVLLRRYGKEEHAGRGEEQPSPEELQEYERAILRQRSTIDIAMEQMEPQYPTWHRVIDLYYRQGLSTEQQGWLLVMLRLGLRKKKCPPLVRCALDRGDEFEDNRLEIPKCREATRLCCHWDYDTWRVQLTKATEALWRAIEDRQKWPPS